MILPSVAILAGGVAKRLGTLSQNTPKSLIEIAGKPFIHHQLTYLSKQGILNVVLCVGHFGEKIKEFIEKNNYNLNIQFSFDGNGLYGTGGAIKNALPLLSDPFFVLYGDSYIELPAREMHETFCNAKTQGLMTIYHNNNKFDKSNVQFENEKILCYDKNNVSDKMNYIDYGVGLLLKKSFDNIIEDKFDLSIVYSNLVKQNSLYGFEMKNRFYEIGSPQGLLETQTYLESKWKLT